MNRPPPAIGLAPYGPVARFLLAIAGALTLAAFLFLGLVAFLIVGGIAIVLSVVVSVRLWWLRRELGQAAPGAARRPDGNAPIEGEFRVVADKRDGE